MEALHGSSLSAEVSQIVEADPRLAFAMAYHDTGWELLRLLIGRGKLEAPPALTDPDADSMVGTIGVVAGFPPFLERFGIAGAAPARNPTGAARARTMCRNRTA